MLLLCVNVLQAMVVWVVSAQRAPALALVVPEEVVWTQLPMQLAEAALGCWELAQMAQQALPPALMAKRAAVV
jgi:hypothetical protein